MNSTKITTRTVGVAVALGAFAAGAVGTAAAEPAPAPKPKPVTATATCTSANPMFVVGTDMLNWKVTAKVLRPGQIEFAGNGTAGARDFVLSQFASSATMSWNNTTTGKFGSVKLGGIGGLPTLNRVVVNTGKGAVTYNVVIRTGAGTEWIGTQVSTPCVGTITA